MKSLCIEPLESRIAPAALLTVTQAFSQAEGNSGTAQMTFTVTASGTFTGTVTVDFATADGTATAGSDYTASSGTLTFTPGASTTLRTFSVPIIGDTDVELNETFTVTLSNVTGDASIDPNPIFGNGVGTATITNDDGPRISVTAGSPLSEGDSGTKEYSFDITLATAPIADTTVNFTTEDLTALAGSDYIFQSGSLLFTPTGPLTQQVKVLVNGDTAVETDETFKVKISSVGGVVTNSEATATILNDEPKITISNASVTEGNLGSVNAVFTVTLSDAPTSDVTVSYATADVTDSAKAGKDYIATSGTLTWHVGDSLTKTILVPVLGDRILEGSQNDTNVITSKETFNVTLSDATAGYFISRATADGEILDDDTGLTVSSPTVNEGNGGFSTVIFTVSLATELNGQVAVNYATADGSAISTSGVLQDYIGTSGTLTWSPGDAAAKTVAVNIIGDSMRELDENFFLNLTPPVGSPLSGTATIKDTGVSGPLDALPTVSINDVSLVEGNAGTSNASFTVTLSAAQQHDVVILYQTQDGTATTANFDYVGIPSGSVTIPAGSTSATVNVQVNSDITDELSETFTVRLNSATLGNSATEALTFTKNTGTGTIRNDDLLVSITPAAITEGDTGTANLNFTVGLSGATTHAVVVPFTITPGTAKVGSDYNLPAQLSITIPAGQVSGTISVPVIGDTRAEAASETFTVTLTSATDAIVSPAVATGTITDNDPTPVVSIENLSAVEGNVAGTPTTFQRTFTVKLSAAAGEDIVVNYATSNGPGANPATGGANVTTANADYINATGSVTIPAGQTERTFNVGFIGDNLNEADETFTVGLSLPNGSIATLDPVKNASLVTIQNDDTPAISIADVKIAEGNSGTKVATFTVSLSKATALPISVDYATADSTATLAGGDYVATNGTLTFSPGQTTRTFDVTINGDTLSELDEKFLVNLSNAVGATISDAQANGTIQNDETTVTIANASITEGNTGTANLDFNLTLAGPTDRSVNVTFSVAAGTATAGADYNLPSAFTVTIPSGQSTGKISIPVIGDLRNEVAAETFTVTITDVTDAAVNGSATATGTINDNDAAPVLSVDPVSIAEGNVTGSGPSATPVISKAAFKVKLSAASAQTVTVNYATADTTATGGANSGVTGADYVTKTGSLTFAPGEIEKTVEVDIVGDIRNGADETFTVTLSGETNATLDSVKQVATGTILNDDALPTISVADMTIAENAGSTAGSAFGVTLSAAAERPITVNFATGASTTGAIATAGTDFTATSGTLNFAIGETSKTVPVTVIDDTAVEANETFELLLNSPTNASLSDQRAVGTITDDEAKPSIVIGDVQVAEGDSGAANATFTVTLSAASAQTITVNFATKDGTAVSSGGTADFTATSGTLSFAPGELSKTISVPVRGDIFREKISEGSGNSVTLVDEKFTVELTSPQNATIAIASGEAEILDGGDSQIAFTISDVAITEGASGAKAANFTVSLSAPSASAITFNAATRNGTAVSGSDYTLLSRSVSISAGSTTGTLAVSVTGDTGFEATESFFVDITNLSAGVTAPGADSRGLLSARGTIYNDDTQVINGGRSFQWIDVDGDLVTLTMSKGVLNAGFNLVDEGTVGGKRLNLLDLTGNLNVHAGTSISIIADKQPGFTGTTDGRVNVGEIRAATELQSQLQFIGIDLGVVTVDGDLNVITAGDSFSTPAISKLEVYSLGVRTPSISKVLGPIGTVHVLNNLEGRLEVIGQEFGTITNLFVDGALKGGSFANSGSVNVTGRIANSVIKDIIGGTGADSGQLGANVNTNGTLGKVKVTGSITGGSGSTSGTIFSRRIDSVTVGGDIAGGSGNFSGGVIGGYRVQDGSSISIAQDGSLAAITVAGDVIGGAGAQSGTIIGGLQIGSARVAGDLIGQAGALSGAIYTWGRMDSVTVSGAVIGGSGTTSGNILADLGTIGTVTIGKSGTPGPLADALKGGDGAQSGRVSSRSNITGLTIYGNILGGSGNGAGGVVSGGEITKFDLRGDLHGADSKATGVDGQPATSVTLSGYLDASRLRNATIGGDLIAGVNNGTGIANSGVIRTGNIDALTIRGDVTGTATNPAVISAAALAGDLGIKSLVINGNVTFAEILSGWNGNANTNGNFRGVLVNADGQIGSITVGGSVQGLNIVAGAVAGAEGRFGDATDAVPAAVSGSIKNDARVISQIASVILKGSILANADTFGIVAQHIVSVKTGPGLTALTGLTAGAGSDTFGTTDRTDAIGLAAAKFRAVELPA